MTKGYREEKNLLTEQDIRDRLRRRLRVQKTLQNNSEPLYFGSILPIYSYGKNGRLEDGRLAHGASSIYGFDNNKWVKVDVSDIEKYGVKREDIVDYLDRENYQLNEQLLGDDVYALRMAMVLMDEGESFETLKDIYDKIHAVFLMGYDHTWDAIIQNFPSLQRRFEKKRPERKKISERLFGKYNEEYERFVLSVKIKSIDRIPENLNKNTFDYIQIEVGLSMLLPMETKKALCKKYIKAIGKHVLIVLSENVRFQKFGIPTNILKVERATIGMDSILYMTLGVKEKAKEKQE